MIIQTFYVVGVCEYVGFCSSEIHTQVTGAFGISHTEDSCNTG